MTSGKIVSFSRIILIVGIFFSLMFFSSYGKPTIKHRLIHNNDGTDALGNNRVTFSSGKSGEFSVKRLELALKYGDVNTHGYFEHQGRII